MGVHATASGQLAGPVAPRASLGAAWHGLSWTLLVLACAVGVVAAVGAILGFRGMVVLTGSMRPAIDPGDVVVVKREPLSTIRAGDVISFTVPGTSAPVTHRVAEIGPRVDGQLAVTTKGDANNRVERWNASPTAQVGRLAVTVPKVGYLTRWASTAGGRIAVFAGLGLLLLVGGLRWAWRL